MYTLGLENIFKNKHPQTFMYSPKNNCYIIIIYLRLQQMHIINIKTLTEAIFPATIWPGYFFSYQLHIEQTEK